jgi:hypothetical protein
MSHREKSMPAIQFRQHGNSDVLQLVSLVVLKGAEDIDILT